MTTEPTDAEIDAHVDLFRWDTKAGRRDLARAVLQRWGQPAGACEPVAWLSTDSIGERYLCFTKPKDSDKVRPLVFGDTAPPTAQAEGLTWTVFNSGAQVAEVESLADAMEYLTPARLARQWCAVCVVDQSNLPTTSAEGVEHG